MTGPLYTVVGDGFVMRLIIYVLPGRMSTKDPGGICWLNYVSFQWRQKHSVSPVLLPAGSEMLTKGAIATHCDNGMKPTRPF